MSTQNQATLLKPNTFLIGAPKCGTTAMSAYLSGHPNVFHCSPKEPSYWAEEFDQTKSFGIDSLSEYEALFAKARPEHLCRIDASTGYAWSAHAVQRIMEYSPDAKILVMFRNPTDVVYALHMEMVLDGQEDVEDFETAWRLQPARKRGEHIPAMCAAPARLQYHEVALFGEQLQRLTGLVPADRLKVLLYDDFRRNTECCYREVLEFLGLPDDGRKTFPVVNASRSPRFRQLARILKQPPQVLQPVERALKGLAWRLGARGLRGWFVRHVLAQRQKRPPLSPNLAAEITAGFADDLHLLESLLKRDLSDWIAAAVPAAPVSHDTN